MTGDPIAPLTNKHTEFKDRSSPAPARLTAEVRHDDDVGVFNPESV